jgi:predicted transcriptional regulator of viral defense system
MCITLAFSIGFAHMMDGPDHDQLYQIAESQGGYFTSHQAQEAGFSYERLSYYAKSGLFLRIQWGIYRLARFPASPFEDLFVAWLHTGPDSVISHESALALYDLTDVIPSKVHVTVPRTASRRRDKVQLHTSQISQGEVTEREGLLVTTVTRTISDLARSGVSEDHIQQAIQEALERGLTNPANLSEAADRYGGRTKRIIAEAIGEHAR